MASMVVAPRQYFERELPSDSETLSARPKFVVTRDPIRHVSSSADTTATQRPSHAHDVHGDPTASTSHPFHFIVPQPGPVRTVELTSDRLPAMNPPLRALRRPPIPPLPIPRATGGRGGPVANMISRPRLHNDKGPTSAPNWHWLTPRELAAAPTAPLPPTVRNSTMARRSGQKREKPAQSATGALTSHLATASKATTRLSERRKRILSQIDAELRQREAAKDVRKQSPRRRSSAVATFLTNVSSRQREEHVAPLLPALGRRRSSSARDIPATSRSRPTARVVPQAAIMLPKVAKRRDSTQSSQQKPTRAVPPSANQRNTARTAASHERRSPQSAAHAPPPAARVAPLPLAALGEGGLPLGMAGISHLARSMLHAVWGNGDAVPTRNAVENPGNLLVDDSIASTAFTTPFRGVEIESLTDARHGEEVCSAPSAVGSPMGSMPPPPHFDDRRHVPTPPPEPSSRRARHVSSDAGQPSLESTSSPTAITAGPAPAVPSTPSETTNAVPCAMTQDAPPAEEENEVSHDVAVVPCAFQGAQQGSDATIPPPSATTGEVNTIVAQPQSATQEAAATEEAVATRQFIVSTAQHFAVELQARFRQQERRAREAALFFERQRLSSVREAVSFVQTLLAAAEATTRPEGQAPSAPSRRGSIWSQFTATPEGGQIAKALVNPPVLLLQSALRAALSCSERRQRFNASRLRGTPPIAAGSALPLPLRLDPDALSRPRTSAMDQRTHHDDDSFAAAAPFTGGSHSGADGTGVSPLLDAATVVRMVHIYEGMFDAQTWDLNAVVLTPSAGFFSSDPSLVVVT